VFQESNITLNINEALYNLFYISLTPEKLFSYQHTGLRSASLYWKDNQYAVRTIGPDDIVGMGDKACTLQDVSLICGITLTHPKEMMLRQRHQQCFQHPNCPLALCQVKGDHSGENIAKYVMEVIQEWGIASKLGYIQMDNASNNDTMMWQNTTKGQFNSMAVLGKDNCKSN
jgi:hypothetical protein